MSSSLFRFFEKIFSNQIGAGSHTTRTDFIRRLQIRENVLK